MAWLTFVVVGVVAILITELLGQLCVTSFDVPRRSKSIRAWRRVQAYGIFFMPGVVAFWFVFLLLTHGDSFIRDLSSWTLRGILLGAGLLIATLFWTRGVLFFLLAKHWQEAEKIITSRGSNA